MAEGGAARLGRAYKAKGTVAGLNASYGRTSRHLPPFLRGIDYVDLRDGGTDSRDQIQKLVAAILGDAGRVGKHPA